MGKTIRHYFSKSAACGLALFLCVCFAAGSAALASAAARPAAYAEALGQALTAMEGGKHGDALPALKTALGQDRNEPLGLIALGTLYLHTGSPTRAAAEFSRARSLAPTEPLAAWGAALTLLAQNNRDAALTAFSGFAPDALPAAPLLTTYTRLLQGDVGGAKARVADVTVDEPNLLRLEIAAIAALRGGDPARGEALLNALLARPKMDRLSEDRALVLPFLPNVAAEAGAPVLKSALGFPAPIGGAPLSGRVTLTPGNDLPGGVAFATYVLEGGGFTATTNYPPFTTDWNTARLPNGLYTLRVTLHDDYRRVVRETSRTLTLANPNAPPSRRLSASQSKSARARLHALLMPRPSRKAAYFALAERAAARGDSEAALRHIESVVAIDPLYQNARASLRKYHLSVLGPREGIWKAATSQKIVALTFDDGPNPLPHRTPALLDALQSVKATGTFFVVGIRAEQAPELLRRMDADGHEIANHSYSHPNLTLMNAVGVERELGRTSVIVRNAIGKRPRFYRPPGGNFNRDVVSSAEALGMSGAYWTVDAVAYEQDNGSPARLTKYVLQNVRPGAIILLHNAPGITIAAIPDIVRGLRAKGYTLVTMSELVRRTKVPVAKR